MTLRRQCLLLSAIGLLLCACCMSAPCPQGKASANGQEPCNDCAPGEFQGVTGEVSCNSCSAGQTSNAGASTCFDEAPAGVDCVVSAWGECSESCGGGTHTRTVTTPASGGGAACSDLSQPCNTAACAPPPCTETDGVTANDAACKCGLAACSTDSGLHCYEASNSCRTFSPCLETDGVTDNAAECRCGSVACSTSTGLRCSLSVNTCHTVPACKFSQVLARNPFPTFMFNRRVIYIL